MLNSIHTALVILFRLISIYLCGSAVIAILASLLAGAGVQMVSMFVVHIIAGALMWVISNALARKVMAGL